MENSELLSAISATGQGDAAAEEPVRLRKVVLFLVEDAVYAFDADEVKEVVLAGEIYPIPFVPAYVSGLINRHGEPHTVIDLKAVLGGGRLDASRVLIMNNGSDQISFLITDIDKIVGFRDLGDRWRRPLQGFVPVRGPGGLHHQSAGDI